MKRFTILIAVFFLLIFIANVGTVQAQTAPSTDNHTAREEAEGKAVFEKLQAKQITCDKLSDENFGSLGEYYMGQMTGSSHQVMNTMMEQMMGKDGEKQMHAVLGKRLSGCDTTVQLPQNGVGFMPMMPPLASLALSGGWMMQNPMMWNFWGGFDFWLFNLSLIVWLAVGILAAIWLFKQISKK